jgi:hypothetical protein
MSIRMPASTPRHVIQILLLAPLTASAQNILPLDFSQNVQDTDAIYPNNSTLGPEYYSGHTFDFVNVTTANGHSIDARVTILGTAGGYEFVGWLPDYNSDAGEPQGDLGVYYKHDGDFSAPLGGIAYTLSFYEGGGAFTNAAVLSDFRLLIYDHDGEPGQSESIRTYEADGFAGFQIRDGSGIHSHHEGDTWRFDAGGQGLSETGPEGSFIAYYQNTSSIRFDMFSTTSPSNPAGNSGIFAAFDGNLSLTGGLTTNFAAFVPVPEPSSASLTAAAISLSLLRRCRTKS